MRWKKLRADEEEYSTARQRHAEYYLEFVQERAAQLRTREEATALHEMEREFDNLRSALEWSSLQDAQLCTQLALAFHQPLHFRGFWNEAREVLSTGWQAAQELGGDGQVLRANLRHYLASIAHDMGDVQTACEYAESNLEEFQKLHDAAGEANTLNLLALLATENGDEDKARELCEAALARWPFSNSTGKAKTLHNLARIASQRGNIEEARQYYEKCLVERRRGGDLRGEAETLGNLGVLAQKQNDLQTAHDFYCKSLKLRRNLRDPLGTAVMLFNLAEVAEIKNDYEISILLFIHAGRIFEELQSAYAAAPTEALERIQEKIGGETYMDLYQRAEKRAWEEVM